MPKLDRRTGPSGVLPTGTITLPSTRGTSSRWLMNAIASGPVMSPPLKRVLIGPGATAFTRMFFAASSTASALVSIGTPPLEAL